MPHEIQLNEVPAGYAATNVRAGETAPIICREFSSSEDGNLFISRLEGLPRTLISLLPGASYRVESTVDHMLAIIRADKTATVYLNDLNYSLTARAKSAIQKGDPVTLDNILDVIRVNLNGLQIPANAGLLVVLSAGWRKGLFFDLTPLRPGGSPRLYDVEVALGHYYAYLNFQHLLSMPEPVWDVFTQQGWFPFIHLRQTTLQKMIKSAKAGFSLDEHLDEITTEVKAAVESRLENWRTHPLLAPHYEFIAAAYRKFVDADFMSATAILFPRIEGVLRTHHFADATAPAASQGNLITSTFLHAELPPHGNSLLLPERFRRYLQEVYFAGFDPRNPTGLSRHTVSHGVAPKEVFNRKGVVLAFLILLQIIALLPSN